MVMYGKSGRMNEAAAFELHKAVPPPPSRRKGERIYIISHS
jgi:hypothetical protein